MKPQTSKQAHIAQKCMIAVHAVISHAECSMSSQECLQLYSSDTAFLILPLCHIGNTCQDALQTPDSE